MKTITDIDASYKGGPAVMAYTPDVFRQSYTDMLDLQAKIAHEMETINEQIAQSLRAP